MPTFAQLAGQFVADGIDVNTPIAGLEEGSAAGTGTINGLMKKVSRVFIEPTRVFGDPFAACVRKVDDPFGVGIEIAGFKTGAVNKKRTGLGPIPAGQVPLAAQVAYANYAYNIDVSIYDTEINKAVTSAEAATQYVAEKLRTPAKTQAQIHYRAWLQLLSDICDGSRSIASFDRMDGHAAPNAVGNAVTYAPSAIVGYAGLIGQPVRADGTTPIVVPAPAVGSLSVISDVDALTIAKELQGIAADMAYEGTDLNKLGIESFVVGLPYLFMEKKTLDAMDNAFMLNAGFKGFPTMSARQFMGKFAQIIEVDAFPAIPTNVTYADKRLCAVLMDPDGMREIIKNATVESGRDIEARATGYNYQGESILAIWQGAPSYAMLADPAEAEG